MMANIVRLLLFLILNIFIFNCQSPQGPIYPKYKNLGTLKEIFTNIPQDQKSITFYFNVYSQIYKENLTGELVLMEKTYIESEENLKMRVSKLAFNLRLISKNINEHIRIREYKGNVFFNGDLLDLHSEDCYTYAKKEYSDRLYVVEGWDCDHMVFLLKKQERLFFINKYNNLYHTLNKENQKRIFFTNWYKSEDIIIYPELLNKKWYGKYLDSNDEYHIFYGKDAEKFIKTKKGAIIYPSNKTINISLVMGDFIFVNKNEIIETSQTLYIY